jgi:hypothetical protein
MAVEFLTKNRKYLRLAYRKAFADQPEAAIGEPWVRSRGRFVPLLDDEIFLRLHDRHSQTPGKFEILEPGEIKDLRDFFSRV